MIIGLIIVVIFLGIFFYPMIKEDIKEKLNKDRIEKIAQNDIELLEQALIERKISLPSYYNNNVEKLKAYLRALLSYADSKVERVFKQKKYKRKQFDNTDLYIFYDKNEALIPSDFLCQLAIYDIPMYAIDTQIQYFGTEKGDGIDINALIENVQKIEDKNFIISNTKIVKWNKLTWYLDGVPADSSNLSGIITDSIYYTLWFGPLGALGGARSAIKEAEEKKKEILSKVKLKFGYRGKGRKWVLNQGWETSSFQSDFKFLLDICPDIRERDIVRKY